MGTSNKLFFNVTNNYGKKSQKNRMNLEKLNLVCNQYYIIIYYCLIAALRYTFIQVNHKKSTLFIDIKLI